MDRGSFFHAIYHMEEKLGRVYAELKPYPLFPLRDYFGGVVHKDAGRHAFSACASPLPSPFRITRSDSRRGRTPTVPLSPYNR